MLGSVATTYTGSSLRSIGPSQVPITLALVDASGSAASVCPAGVAPRFIRQANVFPGDVPAGTAVTGYLCPLLRAAWTAVNGV